MEVVVYLAIGVLGVVFCVSLAVLVGMCCRYQHFKREVLGDHSLRFSKLQSENVDDIIQLSPHISQALSSNQWVYAVSGILEHCVAVLKLCHTLTEKLAKIPLNSISPQLNEVICQATARVVPRFDDLLKSMAAPNVDVRLIEARVVALVTTCWSLVSPFYLMNAKYKEVFGGLINQMEYHQKYLQMAVQEASDNANKGNPGAGGASGPATPRTPAAPEGAAVRRPIIATVDETARTVGNGQPPNAVIKTCAARPAARRTPPEQKRPQPAVASPAPAVGVAVTNRAPVATTATETSNANIRLPDEARRELLGDEAPADPSA